MPMALPQDTYEWFVRRAATIFDGGVCPMCSGALEVSQDLKLIMNDLEGGSKIAVDAAVVVTCRDCGSMHFFDALTIQRGHKNAQETSADILPLHSGGDS